MDRAPLGYDDTYQVLTPGRPLGLGSDDIALAMYYSSYCIDGSAVWLPEHIETQGNGCLFSAIKVMGTIAYLREWSLPDGSATVWRGYWEAIQLLNAALTSPSESLTDGTLLATLIMTAIETKAAPSQSSAYWEVHTNGAAALLELRGASQVTSGLGSALFFQASNRLTTSCILAGRRIPEQLHCLRNATRVHLVDPAHPLWKYQGAMFRLTDFVASIGTTKPITEVQDIWKTVTEAHDVYTELLAVFEDAGPDWQYYKVNSDRFPTPVDHEHVYRTVLAEQLWNGYRTALVILCSLVARITHHLPSPLGLDKPAQLFSDNAVNIINKVAIDTIAAVPRPRSVLRSRATPRHTTSPPAQGQGLGASGIAQHTTVFSVTRTDSLAVPYMHGCQLQWSVYFAANCEFVALPVRRCLLGVLENAAKTMEIKQWKISAERLRRELHGDA